MVISKAEAAQILSFEIVGTFCVTGYQVTYPLRGIIAVLAVQVEVEVPFLVENFFWGVGRESSAVDIVFQKSDKIYFMKNLF